MNSAKLRLIGAMSIFGTVGIFVHYIPLPSATIAFCRGIIGAVFLLLLILITGKKPELPAAWDCPACGLKGITSKFCPDCGTKKPEAPAVWNCPECGCQGITSKFCPDCGHKREG